MPIEDPIKTEMKMIAKTLKKQKKQIRKLLKAYLNKDRGKNKADEGKPPKSAF